MSLKSEFEAYVSGLVSKEVERHQILPKPTWHDRLTAAEHECMRMPTPRKIVAIKSVRERTGFGLKEAKDLVEKFYPNRSSL